MAFHFIYILCFKWLNENVWTRIHFFLIYFYKMYVKKYSILVNWLLCKHCKFIKKENDHGIQRFDFQIICFKSFKHYHD